MSGKFLVSEVGKKYGVSRTSLIYYDNIGLLTPEHIEDNKYRYYSFEDMEKLELILTLKESGLSLKDIKKFMHDPSYDKSAELLRKQKRIIDDKILELQKLQLILDKRIHMVDQFLSLEMYDGIKLDYYPEVTLCKVDIDYVNPNPIQTAANTLKAVLDSNPLTFGSVASKYGYCMEMETFVNSGKLHYKYVSEIVSHTIDEGDFAYAPESYYIRLLHKGSLKTLVHSVHILVNHANLNHYKLYKEMHVVPLVDLWASKSEEDYIYEILIPVEID